MTKEQNEILEKIKSDKTKQKALDYLIKSFPELNEDYILCEVANYEIDGFDYKNQVVNRYIGYTDAVKGLQEKITQLEELLAEQYPDLKQSLEWANQRENELVEENKRLSDEVNGFRNTIKVNVKTIETLNNLTDVQDKELTEAKEIISVILPLAKHADVAFEEGSKFDNFIKKAEAFIKE